MVDCVVPVSGRRESLDLSVVAYTERAETRESKRCGMSAFGF